MEVSVLRSHRVSVVGKDPVRSIPNSLAQPGSARTGCPGLRPAGISPQKRSEQPAPAHSWTVSHHLHPPISQMWDHALWVEAGEGITCAMPCSFSVSLHSTAWKTSSSSMMKQGTPALLAMLHKWSLVACLCVCFSFWIILFRKKWNYHQTKKQIKP